MALIKLSDAGQVVQYAVFDAEEIRDTNNNFFVWFSPDYSFDNYLTT